MLLRLICPIWWVSIFVLNCECEEATTFSPQLKDKGKSCAFIYPRNMDPPFFINVNNNPISDPENVSQLQSLIQNNTWLDIHIHKSWTTLLITGSYIVGSNSSTNDTLSTKREFRREFKDYAADLHIPNEVQISSLTCVNQFPLQLNDPLSASCRRDRCPERLTDSLYSEYEWNVCAILYEEVRCKQCSKTITKSLLHDTTKVSGYFKYRSMFLRPGCILIKNSKLSHRQTGAGQYRDTIKYTSSVNEFQMFQQEMHEFFTCSCPPKRGVDFTPTNWSVADSIHGAAEIFTLSDPPEIYEKDINTNETASEETEDGGTQPGGTTPGEEDIFEYTTLPTGFDYAIFTLGIVLICTLSLINIALLLWSVYYQRGRQSQGVDEVTKLVAETMSSIDNGLASTLSPLSNLNFEDKRKEAGCELTSTELNVTPWKSEQPIFLLQKDPIGQGEFSQVWKVQHTIGHKLAVKQVFLNKSLLQLGCIEKVYREIKHCEQIISPYVVKQYNCWAEGPQGLIDPKEIESLAINVDNIDITCQSATSTNLPTMDNHFLFIQMELCDFTLKQWMRTRPTLEARESLESALMELDSVNNSSTNIHTIFTQLATGLRDIHQKGIIHRDIKPDNIFCTAHSANSPGLWKIGDFGLSIRSSMVSGITTDSSQVANSVAGCANYKSPEMARGLKYSEQTDVFSLGLVFLEVIHPFLVDRKKSELFFDLQFAPNFEGIKGEKEVYKMCESIMDKDFPSKVNIVESMLKRDAKRRIDSSRLCKLLN